MPTSPGDTRRRFMSPRNRLFIVATSVCAALFLLGVVAFQFLNLQGAHASQADAPVPFHVTLPSLVSQSHLNGSANAQQRITLSIGLRVQNQSALNAYVQDVTRPGSVNYHRYLTPAQVIGAFSPSPSLYNALSQYLQSQGFTITHTYSHRLLITFSGTVAQVEHTFSVSISSYTAPSGRVYYANSSDPRLPSWLVAHVQSFTGLDDAVQLQHPPAHQTAIQHATTGAVSCLSQDTQSPPRYYTSGQITSAYNINDLYKAGYRGEGQAIALYELDGFSASDLSTYEACYGQSRTPVQTIVTSSVTAPSSQDSGIIEVELDAELILSSAPQLGRLAVYEAGNNEADRLANWAQIVQDATPVVSTSWGLCEQLMAPSEVQQENVLFTIAAAQGQSIFAASGDSGSAGCAFDNPGGAPITSFSVDDPASQPFVTGVGGTSLTVNATGTYGGETTWNNAPTANSTGGASGGGISQYWTAPSWQAGPGVVNGYSSATPCAVKTGQTGAICREVPDVSLHADPKTGYLIYCADTQAGCSSQYPWLSVGGTSAAAPMWAAFMALTNELSLRQGGFNVGFVNPLLYYLAKNATTYARDFHDITTGTNDYNNYHNGKYPATPHYDLATGLGSFSAFNLADGLATLLRDIMSTRVSPASSTWYFAEGSVGGGFQEYMTIQNPSVTDNATVNITYLFENKSSVTISHSVVKGTRQTFSVNGDLHVQPTDPQQAVSAIVRSNVPVVAERPMYFSYKGISSGTDVVGATNPTSSYYFPSIDTRNTGRTYYSYITMLNPSSTQSATVTVTYYTGSCGLSGQAACRTQTLTVAPLHRGTVTPMALSLYQQLSASVKSTLPIVVERPAYLQDTIPNAGGLTTGAASVVGADAPNSDWLFAEGFTGANFQEYMVLANFSASTANATVTLEYDNGHRQQVNLSIAPLSHIYFDVNKANQSPSGACDTSTCQTSNTSSAEVKSNSPIVAERLMYFHYGSNKISGATETVGEPGPASHSVYSFAEGYTAGSFSEFLTLQNPTNSDETVAVTLFADTYILQQQVVVKARSRQTISINPIIVPIATAYNNMGSDSFDVSLTVQALGTNAKIVAERPMYFNYHGDQGGTDVLGYVG